MAHGLAELIINVGLWTVQGVCLAAEITDKIKSDEKKNDLSRHKRSLPSLISTSESPRAVLIESSSASFGHDCERAINIGFKTSQTFPSMMGTCADIDEYLRKELNKLYPQEYFYIIIGENNAFGFSVDAGQHFVEALYGKYRVLIFSTKKNPQTKFDTHDANSQMTFKWK
ncbi:hypothetical protein I4U23_024136 [Adineta vaga]|nr:hypothetical protein I4U23_024136 [Adineta vaga]